MMKHLRPVVLAAAALLLAIPSLAGDLKLSMQDGRVTLLAQDVPLREVLAEWARIGHTTIVNGDKLTGPPVTLQLVDVPERQALDILLRSASGYVAAQRASMQPGASLFDRVMILPTSRPPAQSASAPPPPAFNRPMMAQPMPSDDDDPPDAPVMPSGAAQPGPVGMQVSPGMRSVPPPDPGAGTQPANGQPPVVTSPRPGILPTPPTPNPAGRGGQPGSGRGEPGGE